MILRTQMKNWICHAEERSIYSRTFYRPCIADRSFVPQDDRKIEYARAEERSMTPNKWLNRRKMTKSNLKSHISHLTSKYVIIVAGGSGTRMGAAVPKQFLLINGMPVLMHTMLAFYNSGVNPDIRGCSSSRFSCLLG
jgi:polysaccharide pyruvyl transferase WcaK-like protein